MDSYCPALLVHHFGDVLPSVTSAPQVINTALYLWAFHFMYEQKQKPTKTSQTGIPVLEKSSQYGPLVLQRARKFHETLRECAEHDMLIQLDPKELLSCWEVWFI